MAIEVFLESSAADVLTDWETIWTNLATNPSFEGAGSSLTLRTNLQINPSLNVDATGWAAVPGTGGTNAGARTASLNGFITATGYRATWSVGTGAISGGITAPVSAVLASTVYSASILVNPTVDQRLVLYIDWRDAGAVLLSTSTGTPVDVRSSTIDTLTVTNVTSPVGAATATLRVEAVAGGIAQNWPASSFLQVSNALLESSVVNGIYFDGTNRPHVRRNLNPRPQATSAWTGQGFGTSGVGSVGTVVDTRFQGANSARRMTWSTAPSNVNADSLYLSPGTSTNTTGGKTYTATARVAVENWPGATFRLIGSNAAYSATTTTNNGDGTFTLRATFVPTAGVSFNTVLIAAAPGSTLPTTSSAFLAGDLLVETGNVPGTYFDGGTADAAGYGYEWTVLFNNSVSYAYDLDYTITWVGAANATPGALTYTSVLGASGVAVRSIHWTKYGTYSLRVAAANSGINDTYSAPGGDSGGGLRFGMVAGKTYTALATVRTVAPQTGTLNTRARRIVVFHRIGTGAYTEVLSAQAPNVAGVTDLSVTFTLPAGTTEAFIRLYNGASVGNGEVWYDTFALVTGNGTYSGNYFDGSLSDSTLSRFLWTGPVNASTSTYDTRSYVTDGRGQAGGATSVENYTVRLDATPILATETSASTPDFNVTVQPGDLFDMFRARGRGILLNDTEKRGSLLGLVDGFANDPEGVTYSGITPLSKLVGRIELPVFNGTFSAFVTNLFAYVDPTIPLQFTTDVGAIPLVLPTQSGTAWDILNEVCLAHRVECAVIYGTVTFRPIRSAVFLYDDIVEMSHEYSTGPKSKYIEVTNYNSAWIDDGLIWPRAEVAERVDETVPSIGNGQTLVIDLDLGDTASAASIQQPVCVLPPSAPASSHFVALGNNNVAIHPLNWVAWGGSLSVEILNNGSLLRVTVVAPNYPALAPFQIARLNEAGEPVNSLRIYGDGVTIDPEVLRFETGANPTELVEEVGASITLASVGDYATAYDVAQDVMAQYSVPQQTLSGTLALPDLVTISDELAELAPPSVLPGDELEWFAEQLFTVLIGARIRYAFSYFRITHVEFGPDQITFDAVADTILDDVEDVWGDLTYSQFEAVMGPDLTWEEWEAIPLYLGENAYGTGYYGEGVYGGDTLGA